MCVVTARVQARLQHEAPTLATHQDEHLSLGFSLGFGVSVHLYLHRFVVWRRKMEKQLEEMRFRKLLVMRGRTGRLDAAAWSRLPSARASRGQQRGCGVLREHAWKDAAELSAS